MDQSFAPGQGMQVWDVSSDYIGTGSGNWAS